LPSTSVTKKPLTDHASLKHDRVVFGADPFQVTGWRMARRATTGAIEVGGASGCVADND
jgi:hypothetical protein